MVYSNKPPITDGRARLLVRKTKRLSPSGQFLAVAVLGLGCVVALFWSLTAGSTPLSVLIGMGFYSSALWIAFRAFGESYPHAALGWCNTVTIFRATLVSVLVAWLFTQPVGPWPIIGVATLAFVLDGFDGWLARREGYASNFGARFDMEVDSVLALALAFHAYLSGNVGIAVILLGLPRYIFFVAHYQLPWLAGDLPPRFSRKVVCVLQISALIILLLPMLRAPLSDLIVGLVAAALIWSFWLDVRVLLRSRS
jgi:phosphatidylglycerophosphate synthase